MRIAYTDEQVKLRDELRAYFAQLMTPEVAEEMAAGEMGGPRSRETVAQMGKDGWLGVGWPKEYGGRGFGPMEQFIFYDEAQRAGAPIPFLTINTVGPAIMQFGSEQMKADILPRILAGTCFFSIGYSEPQAGTDLASLKTRAVRDGDEWVINGQKIFTSLTDHADYIWLACRTNLDASKHKGISIILVPTTSEGFSYTPIHTLGDVSTYATYYSDVRVPVSNTIGEIDGGWTVITTQLNYERISLASPAGLERAYLETRRWAQQHKLPDGRRVVDQEWVQVHLAKVHARLEGLRLLNWKNIWQDSVGKVSIADSSAVKVYGTTIYCECYGLLLEVLGAAGILKRTSPGAALAGRIERAYRGTLILTFGGGTNEIQRDLIAIFGLGMPRSLR
ncbi:MAG TPA: acyl-CoA dehydrogenase family protein [Mycobacteriales bacterium]|jgi:alkylation response protein AidB-like acyl-CoA dehydrogenase|nr:acyl-CoA dehydrogenase family protein [Mycobacteriales bacterium]